MPASQIPDYPALLVERDGRFCLIIRELGLAVSASTLEEAYDKLAEAKARYLADVEDAGLRAFLTVPDMATNPAQPSGLGRFAAKAAIIAVAIVLVVQISGWTLSAVVDSAVARVGLEEIGGRHFWTGLEAAIYEAGDADQEIAPEQRERLLGSIAAIVERARPFVMAVEPLFPARECVIRWDGQHAPQSLSPE